MQREYKIAMLGLGSIGKRHLGNIEKVLNLRNIKYTIDLFRRKDSKALDDATLNIVSKVFIDEETIEDDYDIIFITNPTNLHYSSIKKYSSKTKNMFIEKPVFDKSEYDLDELDLKENGVYYVACPLRYTSVIQYVKKNIDLSKVFSFRAICSSYLPNWRPDLDYRKTYSAHMDQGGGVSIDLIHEWDYLMYLFGPPSKVLNFRGKYSDLEINSDDLSIYIAKYDNLLGELHLDYFGRESIREVQLFTSDETIVADLIKNEIRFSGARKNISFEEDRNDFQLKEISVFFDIIEGKQKNENDILKGLNTLKVIDGGRV